MSWIDKLLGILLLILGSFLFLAFFISANLIYNIIIIILAGLFFIKRGINANF